MGVLEVTARLAYPEFTGHIHSSDRTLGLAYARKNWNGFFVRLPNEEFQIDASRKLTIILGDSISNGYGTPFEDIFWVQASRLEAATTAQPYYWLALAGYGNNLADSAVALDKITAMNMRIGRVIYQFNFNDLMPASRADLQNIPAEGMVGSNWFRTIAIWRYEYLNHSTFLRVAQHYGGQFSRKRAGSCEERGLDALGPYTWTFGSRVYVKDSEAAWKNFEDQLAHIKERTGQAGADFIIFISPLVFDIDTQGRHPHYNHTHLDFGCATIEPRARLAEISGRLGIKLIDPTSHMRSGYEARIKEGNFQPFFFTADENHFTPTAARYAAESLFAGIAQP